MHLGRLYPYAAEFWQMPCFFWPGYVPRKVVLACPPGHGIWSTILNPGLVSDVMIPDGTITFGPAWNFSSAPVGFSVDIQMIPGVPFVVQPLAQVTIIELATFKIALCEGHYRQAEFVFRQPVWTHVRNDFGSSGSGLLPVSFRGARWSEV